MRRAARPAPAHPEGARPRGGRGGWAAPAGGGAALPYLELPLPLHCLSLGFYSAFPCAPTACPPPILELPPHLFRILSSRFHRRSTALPCLFAASPLPPQVTLVRRLAVGTVTRGGRRVRESLVHSAPGRPCHSALAHAALPKRRWERPGRTHPLLAPRRQPETRIGLGPWEKGGDLTAAPTVDVPRLGAVVHVEHMCTVVQHDGPDRLELWLIPAPPPFPMRGQVHCLPQTGRTHQIRVHLQVL